MKFNISILSVKKNIINEQEENFNENYEELNQKKENVTFINMMTNFLSEKKLVQNFAIRGRFTMNYIFIIFTMVQKFIY